MARITRFVPGNPGDDNNRKHPGKRVLELNDVDGDKIEVFDLGSTFHLKITERGSGDYRYADVHPLILQTLALRVLAYLNKNNHN